MPIPDSIRVKISTEAVESITLTAVVARELPLAELVAEIVPITGKDHARVRDILNRGTIVIGGSRFRWERLQAEDADVAVLLAPYPDADPTRAFDLARCRRVVLTGGAHRVVVEREHGEQKRLLKKRSFWDCVTAMLEAEALEYAGYSYRTRADRFLLRLRPHHAAALREAVSLVAYDSLARQLASAQIARIEFETER